MIQDSTIDLTAAARGLGRYFQRTGLTRREAVKHVIASYPMFEGYEFSIGAGWTAELMGR